MTTATSETTKLNFITDQGSTRATVRCACRAVRFGGAAVALCAAPRDAAGLSHANAAGETDGDSPCAGRSPADAAEPVSAAEPADEGAPDVARLSLPGVTA